MKTLKSEQGKKKYDKYKLYKIALREACIQLVLNGYHSSVNSARHCMMLKAKKIYGHEN